jgi:hypothetical protein
VVKHNVISFFRPDIPGLESGGAMSVFFHFERVVCQQFERVKGIMVLG